MRLIKLGAAVLNQTPLAWDANARNIANAIAKARDEGVSILCLPELCISGYGCEDAFHAPGTHQVAASVLGELLPLTKGMVVSFGLPIFYEKGLYNAAALVCDGQLLGFSAKQHLAGDGLHYEPRWFKAWPAGKRGTVDVLGASYPIGDLFFEVGGVKLGFEICEDAWVANRPGNSLAIRGVDIILNPSASHFAFGKHEVRKGFVVEGSRAFGVAYVYANLLGNEAGRAIYDGDAHIASGGRLVASGTRFSFSDFELSSALVDIDENRMIQARTASYRPEVGDASEDAVHGAFGFPELDPQAPPPTKLAVWQGGPFEKEEAFARAIALGLFDYLRKSRSHGFVVSLSGGADSAAVACLVALMVDFATSELGAKGLQAKLGHIPEFTQEEPRAVTQGLLTCAYQATRNSSEVTRNAARGVAEAVGARFLELSVDSLVEDYKELVAGAIGRPLSWETDDLALQNIQARVRGPSVWMLANIGRALLLATSNRSEAAVGYATMDGDTCGGLSPIAGIDKAFLRHWLRWLERTGPEGGAPIAALGAVNVQAPTAELRPHEAAQTDEKDLMPYEVLEAIEDSAIRDKHSPLEVWKELRVVFPDYGADELCVWVSRFFRLWCRNQWKRERYAPSFHVDDKNLDPKTWCRFPILSGGYEREIAEMVEYVAKAQ